MGVIGQGKIFGDVDAFNDRQYIYTVRTLTPNAKVYFLSATDFARHVETIDLDKMNFN